jgi:hypothetical protein
MVKINQMSYMKFAASQLEEINKKAKEIFKDLKNLTVNIANTDGKILTVAITADSSDRYLRNVLSINIAELYGQCGFGFCSNYHANLSENTKERKEFFDWLCVYLYEQKGTGGLVTVCYAPTLGNQMPSAQHKVLLEIGFELLDFYNNGAHVKQPTKNSFYLQGVYLRKLSDFKAPVTIKEMNKLTE